MPKYRFVSKETQNVAFLGELHKGDVIEITDKKMIAYVDAQATDSFKLVDEKTPLFRKIAKVDASAPPVVAE